MTVRIAGLGFSYAANILLSRLLGVQAYGEYAIALSWALVLVLPAKAGFDNSALRYSAIYLERRDFAALRGFVGFASATVCAISLVMVAVTLVAGSRLIPVDGATRAWTALLILPLALLSLYSVVLRTAARIFAAQFYEQMLRPALMTRRVSIRRPHKAMNAANVVSSIARRGE